MKCKNIVCFTIAWVCMFNLFVGFISCSRDQYINECIDINDKYDENKYKFNLINLWGSKAAVVDKGGYYLFQGDILLKKHELDTLSTRGAARIDKRWDNNKVYYVLSGFPSQYSANIFSAMANIEENSYLRFIPRLENESNYIELVYENKDEWVAYSDYIGCKGGEQEIHLSNDACEIVGVIIHELCHALGLYHEMCRVDRDDYVKIDFSVMNDEERHQFKTYTDLEEEGVDVGNFDFNSIMMYSSFMNDKVVMTKLDGSIIIAQRAKLSSGDKVALAKAQPAVLYTFYSYYTEDGNIDSDLKYQRVKYLRCPEGANIKFKFQQYFSPSSASWGNYSLEDFDIKTTISFINDDSGEIFQSKLIPMKQTSGYEDSFFTIQFPEGRYRVIVSLSGAVKGESNSSKLSVLKKIMYNPRIYLHLEQVLINNLKIKIPNGFEYPADVRSETFISI